ncbi:McrC family protein [Morganella morganii]|uniref:McrC family protein n=1 Tax=Morganella morganii TaxID=582 RepID=UPI0004698C68|nr:mcrbc 5-methylcytosine restriction system component-like protein [Morganella morganii]
MMIIEAKERTEVNVDISLIVKHGYKLDIYPEIRNFFSIDYKPKNNALILFSGKYIGLIPINESLAIDIKPKFSIGNINRMILTSGEYLHALTFFNRHYSESAVDSNITFKFLIECFIWEMKVLYENGLLKDFIKKNTISSNIKGKLNISDSMKTLWAKGGFHKASVDFYEFTPDNDVNKFIKCALFESLVELRRNHSELKKLINDNVFFLEMFDGVKSFQGSNPLNLYNPYSDFGIIRNYYKNIVKSAELILSKKGISFELTEENVFLNSYYIDMETIFEKYLFVFLKEYFLNNHPELSIKDGNTDGKKKFFNAQSIATGDAKPDVIIKKGDSTLLIADAKYKSKTKDTDRYQIISHAVSFDCSNTVLISPRPDNHKGAKMRKIGDVGDALKINVYEYFIDLSNPDLENEESELARSLFELIDI